MRTHDQTGGNQAHQLADQAGQSSGKKSGLPHAFGAYLIWGLLPIYLLLVKDVPPFEFVGWRIIWTLPFCLLIVAVRGQFPALKEALSSAHNLALLTLSAMLIATNWLVYVWAIANGEIYAASMGYYLNPLINVLLGTLFLAERLSRLQWAAVALASLAVAALLAGAVTSLWISLTLAGSFGLYGLVRKQIGVGSLPGLTIETMILILPSIAMVWFFAQSSSGTSFGGDLLLTAAIIFSGVVTAVPLLLFAVAARRMDYSTLGFVQYLAPTLVFILGLTVFGQELKPAQLGSFMLIWSAVALFIWDVLRQNRKNKRQTAA